MPPVRVLSAVVVVLLSLVGTQALGQDQPDEPPALAIEAPSLVVAGDEFEVTLGGLAPGERWTLRAGDESLEGVAEGPEAKAAVALASGNSALRLRVGERRAEASVRAVPGWMSLLPPLLAILLALALRHVVLALALGVFAGAFVVHDYDPLAGLLRTVDHYAVGAAGDADHASILIFSLLLGGMIGLITKSGGGLGLAAWVTRKATDARRGQLAAWSLGVVIFFDDYANSLLVGSSMRPITDRLRISREKLAFLVDATAAPVASVALVSSWIGVEIGYIAEQFAERGIEADPYVAFLQTLPYRFYPWLMLAFGLMLVWTRRDFGAMRKAELRARTTGKLFADGATPASDFDDLDIEAPPRARNALVPIVTVIAAATLGMIATGMAACEAEGIEPTVRAIFGNANSLNALLWASAAGGVAALAMALGTKALRLGDGLEAWLAGMKSMLLACVILVLAWSLGAICKELHTADVVVAAIGDGLRPALLPAVVFVVAALVSFATGTSWGTMAILFPLVVPLADELAPGDMNIVLGAVSSILAGSVWGDHCSPISDTTIMSSMASSCDHTDHVRTQLPYALTVGGVSLLVGELGVGFGLYPAWFGLLLGVVVLAAVVRFVGRVVPDAEEETDTETDSDTDTETETETDPEADPDPDQDPDPDPDPEADPDPDPDP